MSSKQHQRIIRLQLRVLRPLLLPIRFKKVVIRKRVNSIGAVCTHRNPPFRTKKMNDRQQKCINQWIIKVWSVVYAFQLMEL